MGENEMQQGFVVSGFLFPPHEDAAVAIEPRRDAFDNPTSGTLAQHALFGLLLAPRANVRHIAPATDPPTDRFAVVTFVEAQMLPTAGALGARQRDAIERIEEKFLVVGVGAADRKTKRHAAAVGENRPLDSQLTAIGRVFAGFFPRPAVPWSSNHRRSANSNRCLAGDRSARAFSATPCQTRPARSTLESSDARCCRCRTRVAVPSTDSPCGAHRRCRSSPAADWPAVDHLVANSHTWVTTEQSDAKMHRTSANSIHETPSSPAPPPCRCEKKTARRSIRVLAVI